MKRTSLAALLLSFTALLSSCEVIGGIFKAGVWSGVIIVVVVLALIIWLISKFTGGNRE